MKRVIVWLIVLMITVVAEVKAEEPQAKEFNQLFCAPGEPSSYELRNKDATIKLGVEANFAGAITSLMIGGVNAVNAFDHGYAIQDTLRDVNLNECWNPTEAGASTDKLPSSSHYISGCAINNKLFTSTDMAFYTFKGEPMGFCPDKEHPERYSAVQPSGYLVSKIVEMDALGLSNVIRINSRFTIPSSNPSYVTETLLETPTEYLTADYSQTAWYNLGAKAFNVTKPISEANNEGGYAWFAASLDIPVVSNGKVSIATYAPKNSWYSIHKFVSPTNNREADTEKVTVYNKIFGTAPGDYYYETYIIVSTPTRVKEDIDALLARMSPTGNVDGATCQKVVGWAGDRNDSSQPIRVDVYADGVGSDHLLGSAMANLISQKPVCEALGLIDASCNHGFIFNLPEFIKDGKPHTIEVYGINMADTSGENIKLSGSGKTINCSVVTPTAIPTIGVKVGDANGDGKADLLDFSIWKQEYSGNVTTKRADFNKDNKVDLLDFSMWKREYGK